MNKIYAELTGTEITCVIETDGTPVGAVEIGEHPNWSQRPGPHYKAHWINGAVEWQDNRNLATVQAEKWEAIKLARATAEYSPITVGENTFDANQESQQKISGVVQLALMAGPGHVQDWTLTNNTTVSLSQAEIISLGIALGQRTGMIYATARALRDQINAAQTVSEVDLVTW